MDCVEKCSCFTTMLSVNTPTDLPKGLPDTKVGTFTQELYDEAKKERLGRYQYENLLGSASSGLKSAP